MLCCLFASALWVLTHETNKIYRVIVFLGRKFCFLYMKYVLVHLLQCDAQHNILVMKYISNHIISFWAKVIAVAVSPS